MKGGGGPWKKWVQGFPAPASSFRRRELRFVKGVSITVQSIYCIKGVLRLYNTQGDV